MTELEPPRASAAPNWERVVFAALLVLHLAPIIWLDHFATQDGPAHVANAAIINQLLDRDCPVVSETFGLRIAKFPNVLERVILVAFARALSPTLAEKLLQLAIVASLAIGMRLVIRRIAPANAFLSVGAFSLVYAYPFSMGFYAFSLGLALMSFTFATWLAHREAFSVRWAIGFALLTSATFLAHPLPFVALGVFLGAGALSAAWADRSALGNDDPRRGDFATLVVRRCWLPLLALAPGSLLGLQSTTDARALVEYVNQPGADATAWEGFLLNLGRLVRNEALLAYSEYEAAFAIVFVGGLVGATAYSLRGAARRVRHPLRTGLATAAVALLVAFFSTPDSLAIGGFIRLRVLLIFWIALLFWLATHPFERRASQLLQVALLVSALGLFGAKVSKLAELDALLDEYLSAAPSIAEGRTLLPLNYIPGDVEHGGGPSWIVDPLIHASGYLSAGRCIAGLENYEAGYTAHSSTGFLPGKSPYGAGYGDYLPHRTNLSRYAASSLHPVDYILTWRAIPALHTASPSRGAAIKRQLMHLRRRYDRVFVSSPNGWMHVWRRKGLAE